MKHLCVFCGSHPGRSGGYLAAANALGREMVRQGCGLVYGGGSTGMMGAVAEAVISCGGEAIGVVPDNLFQEQHLHQALTRLDRVANLSERKARMTELSDGFVVLPGGLGTLDELFEMWVSLQLGIEPLPIGLLNTDGYYDRLLGFLDNCVEEAFINPQHRTLLVCETQPQALIDEMLHR